MISLIINADDLGSNPMRDRGILKAFQKGIVTSASMLANGASFNTAIAEVKRTRIPVGVHLNLAEGRALTGPIRGLTGPCGELPGKEKLRQGLAANRFKPEEIRKEFNAQIQKILDAGVRPDHLDGHQHCQLFPPLTSIVTELAKVHAIPAMRSALPAEDLAQDPTGALGKELALYRQLSQRARAGILAAGLQTPDGLIGMPLLNRLNTTTLCKLLDQISEGCWELMVHPGYVDQASENPFDGAQREVELAALLAPEARQIITRRHIRLCDFGDLSCAF